MIRRALLPKERRPMSMTVSVDGQEAGRLEPAKKEVQTVDLDLKKGPSQRHAQEEVVTELEGEVTLPEGEHTLHFVHRNMVDGMLDAVTFAAP